MRPTRKRISRGLTHIVKGGSRRRRVGAVCPAGAAGTKGAGNFAEAVLRSARRDRFFSIPAGRRDRTAKALVSRTGYTGEDGFEIYIAAQDGPEMWETILAAGEDDGLVPVGLGARDTLRLEAALPLYGHELAADISPLEAGLIDLSRWIKRILSAKTRWFPARRNARWSVSRCCIPAFPGSIMTYRDRGKASGSSPAAVFRRL